MKNFLFYSCKKATELIEKSKVINLNPIEKSRLAIHVSMCDSCRTYHQTSDILDRKLSEHLHQQTETESDLGEKKEALLKKLKIE